MDDPETDYLNALTLDSLAARLSDDERAAVSAYLAGEDKEPFVQWNVRRAVWRLACACGSSARCATCEEWRPASDFDWTGWPSSLTPVAACCRACAPRYATTRRGQHERWLAAVARGEERECTQCGATKSLREFRVGHRVCRACLSAATRADRKRKRKAKGDAA